ncbi:Hypothetical protein IALB_0685 [Ignavibacterium album JCM 16511]|uniref:Transmembrane protein n=1 Tax=Ignavibacterium album (strain DSM 19864 / JCM 16511 / NBRC 101810 / Mat9-16) TaxID=945713 RepID=I0AHE0_IGNAJ|nr:hypothetical protein [Ignavibacterium album]AFH48397.1 Hypothetical protein IALB_0685 [Ignavibacterium album JCM 16511]
MSAQTKTKVQKTAKILGIALFAFFMFFNIKFAVRDNSSGDIDLFGLKVSVFTNSTYATSSDTYCYKWYPPPTYCYWPPVQNCMCDIIVTP